MQTLLNSAAHDLCDTFVHHNCTKRAMPHVFPKKITLTSHHEWQIAFKFQDMVRFLLCPHAPPRETDTPSINGKTKKRKQSLRTDNLTAQSALTRFTIVMNHLQKCSQPVTFAVAIRTRKEFVVHKGLLQISCNVLVSSFGRVTS